MSVQYFEGEEENYIQEEKELLKSSISKTVSSSKKEKSLLGNKDGF